MTAAILAIIKTVVTFLTSWGPLAGLVTQIASGLGAATIYVWTALTGLVFAFFGGLMSQLAGFICKGVFSVAWMPFAYLVRCIRRRMGHA